MHKTISVMLFKRKDYSRQVLEHIGKAAGVEDWSVYVYCDNPGSDEIFRLAQAYPFVKKAHLAPKRRGMKKANPWALRTNFLLYKSDLNLHVEDDVLIGPDALKFVEDCAPYIQGDVGSVSLAGYMEKIAKPQEDEMNRVFKYPWFTCGFGWATTRNFYINEFANAKDVGDIRSWAKNFNGYFQTNGFKELRSYVRRSKNIGKDGSTNPIYGQGVLNCEDFKDEWTGGTLEPVWESDYEDINNDDLQ
jgi:hypothetical protein